MKKVLRTFSYFMWCGLFTTGVSAIYYILWSIQYFGDYSNTTFDLIILVVSLVSSFGIWVTKILLCLTVIYFFIQEDDKYDDDGNLIIIETPKIK